MRNLGKVIIQEVGVRDGLQNEKAIVSTARKLVLISDLERTGLSRIECTSFVSPRWIPQMADHQELLRQVMQREGPINCKYGVLIPNFKGYESYKRIANSAKSDVAVFISASEGFSLKNINKSVEESIHLVEGIAKRALNDGFQVRAYLSSVIACPYDGSTPPETVALISRQLIDAGCYEVSLGDTIGAGTPTTVEKMLQAVLAKVDVSQVAIHAHDTYGNGIPNTLKAVEMGVRVVDSSIAGLGGCPYSKSPTGNIATEKIVERLHFLGYDTGLDLQKLRKVAADAHCLVGRAYSPEP